MGWRALGLGCALLVGGGLSVPTASGEKEPDPTIDISISVLSPEGCPRHVELRNRLRELLGEVKRLAPARVVVTIEPSDGAYPLSLEVKIIDADGEIRERELGGPNCDKLLSTAATILNVALGEATNHLNMRSLLGLQAEPTDSAERSFRFRSRAQERPVREAPVAARVGAVTAIDGGTLPDVAPGIGLLGALTNGPLRVEIAGLYFPRRRAIADATSMAGGDLTAFTAASRACLRPGPVALCGGGEWSLITATGFGTDQRSTETFFLWGLTMGARFEMKLGERVVIATTGELVARPRRPLFRVANPDRIVHTPGWLGARAWLVGEVELF